MMTLAPPPSMPLTLNERSLAPDVLRVAATFEEYLAFAEQCAYTVEYINGEIISMSQASLPHESLVTRIGHLLLLLFDERTDMEVFSSNIKLFIEATGDSVNADVTLVQGQPNYLRLPSGNLSTATITNPTVIVEVLSDSTQAFDLGDKLELYKQLPALQQVLFVSQTKPWVMSYVRSETPGVWLHTSAHALTGNVPVLDKSMALADIYRKITFE